ncbi:MAG: nucleoside phosphorylase [Chlorobi bacterium]|nr:nucleoside phosphorylase [Chlorobiota bacterium]
MNKLESSELILNKDGSIFHLHLKPEHIAGTVILVGDQDRVGVISKYFDKIEHKIQNREFVTHTGYYKGTRITVTSTGIGTDNIDIVVNELDAISNIDLQKRKIKDTKKQLNLIRIGTSGALQADIPVDTYVVSEISIGFDGLLNFYTKRDSISNLAFEEAFKKFTNWDKHLASPYVVEASEKLVNTIGKDLRKGVTISAPGFYGPQGRVLRIPLADNDLNQKIESFEFQGKKITNFEMESSAIFGLSKHLGHNALTICNIIANRITKEYSSDYKKSVEKLIVLTLDRIASL